MHWLPSYFSSRTPESPLPSNYYCAGTEGSPFPILCEVPFARRLKYESPTYCRWLPIRESLWTYEFLCRQWRGRGQRLWQIRARKYGWSAVLYPTRVFSYVSRIHLLPLSGLIVVHVAESFIIPSLWGCDRCVYVYCVEGLYWWNWMRVIRESSHSSHSWKIPTIPRSLKFQCAVNLLWSLT